MIRSKKFFTVGSIVSMVIMFVVLMYGFDVDGYAHLHYGLPFADYVGALYWPLFALSMVYITFGIVAIALYNKRIKAINILNLMLTSVTYMFAMLTANAAISFEYLTFANILIFAIGIAFPFHFVAEIFALIAQRYKTTQEQPTCIYQEPVYYATNAVPTAVSTNDAIEMLKQLKELYEAGVLTEEEYTSKRQQYVSKI